MRKQLSFSEVVKMAVDGERITLKTKTGEYQTVPSKHILSMPLGALIKKCNKKQLFEPMGEE